MIGNEPAVGDRVHQEGRPHPTKDGWMQANGIVVNIFGDDEDEREVVVEFGEDDLEIYNINQLEWSPILGGHWRVA